MGWRFRRSFRIAPGIRLNMGKSGFTSLSIGGRGATLNLGKRGVTSTVSLPGTGLSYQHRYRNQPPILQTRPLLPAASTSGRTISFRAFAVGAVVVGGYLVLRSPTSSPPLTPVTTVTAPVVPAVLATAIAVPVSSQTAVPQTVMARGPAITIPTRRFITIQANVRSAPSMSEPVVRTFMRGQVVQALQTENGWTRVAEQDGEPIGWMHNSVLK
jgi:Protein of unknown function (DUF4236)/Bacterial SH3 domain